ncbi:MAG: hypothetical protein ABIG66_01290 [Candidatus Kerfeldbacteria bacterium]
MSTDWNPLRKWERAVNACGFHRVDPDINESRFPLMGIGDPLQRYKRYRLALVTPGRWMFTNDLLTAFAANQFERPSFGDAMAFAHRFPEEQLRHPVAIMCEPWLTKSGGLVIPCLTFVDDERRLTLFTAEHNFSEYWRFLIRIPKAKGSLVTWVNAA